MENSDATLCACGFVVCMCVCCVHVGWLCACGLVVCMWVGCLHVHVMSDFHDLFVANCSFQETKSISLLLSKLSIQTKVVCVILVSLFFTCLVTRIIPLGQRSLILLLSY